MQINKTALEFFAGGGMAREGLSGHFDVVWANDICPKKAAAYRMNYGDDVFVSGDVAHVNGADLPAADLAWSSFPCTDLSLAGGRAGLAGARSGTVWSFIRVLEEMKDAGKLPPASVLENVPGFLTSHGGEDFRDVCAALVGLGYCVGAVEIDAVNFVPQSRSRIFVIAALPGGMPAGCLSGGADRKQPALLRAFARFPESIKEKWVWWRLPPIQARTQNLIDILEDDDGLWDPPAMTFDILQEMAPIHYSRVAAAVADGSPQAGAMYRRTRNGATTWEIRFDGVAGALRTASGGSSVQRIMRVEGGDVKTRRLSPREAARLQGLPESYRLPEGFRDAYSLLGDGVCVPVVRAISSIVAQLPTAP